MFIHKPLLSSILCIQIHNGTINDKQDHHIAQVVFEFEWSVSVLPGVFVEVLMEYGLMCVRFDVAVKWLV